MNTPITNPTALNLTPGVKFDAPKIKLNPLVEGLEMAFRPGVSGRMLEGLREDNSPLSQLGRMSPMGPWDRVNSGVLTQEQMAQIALQQAMGLAQ